MIAGDETRACRTLQGELQAQADRGHLESLGLQRTTDRGGPIPESGTPPGTQRDPIGCSSWLHGSDRVKDGITQSFHTLAMSESSLSLFLMLSIWQERKIIHQRGLEAWRQLAMRWQP